MTISVLMPVYNAGAHLAQAIESILAQSDREFEFLIIDDCSTDDSASVIGAFAARDARIRAIFHSVNCGLAPTLNEGLSLARGEFVARMDQDDESLPERLVTQAAFLKANPEVAAVGSWAFNMGRTRELDRLVRLPFTDTEITIRLPVENCLYHPSVMMRRSAVLAMGGYRGEFKNAEDYDLWLRLSREHALANIPRPLLRYRLSVSGMTMGRKWEQLYYCFLAQESYSHPDQPISDLKPLVDQRLAAINRQQYFDEVTDEAVTRLLGLGHAEDARRLYRSLAPELSPAVRVRLERELPSVADSIASTEEKEAHVPRTFTTPSKPFHPWTAPVFALFLLLPSLVWIFTDEKVWPWDQSWYGEVSVDLWWTLLHQPSGWLSAMLAAFGTKAPGISWLGQFFVPIGSLFGSIEGSLLLFQVLCSFASLLLWFKIGQRLWRGDRRGGFLAMAMGAGAPLFVGLTHQYVVEPLQLAATAWFFWIALSGGDYSRLRLLGLGVMAASLGIITKVTTPLYVFFPGLIVVAQLLLNERWWSPGRKGRAGDIAVLAMASATLAFTTAWYAKNFGPLRDFVSLASTGEAALAYGKLPAFWPKWTFWLTAFQQAFFAPFAGIIFAAAMIACIGYWVAASAKSAALTWRHALIVAAAAEILLVLFVFTRQVNEETRYLLPLLTCFLVLVIAGLGRLPRGVVFTGLFTVALGGWGWVHLHALGAARPSPSMSYWLIARNPDKTQKRELRRIIAATSSAATDTRVNVSGYEAPWFNANSLAFYAAKHRLRTGYRCYYTSLGYSANDTEAAWQRMVSLNPVYFITLTPDYQERPPNFLNQVALPILDRVEHSPQFSRASSAASPQILLYRYSPSLP